jgi:hypothetical protein
MARRDDSSLTTWIVNQATGGNVNGPAATLLGFPAFSITLTYTATIAANSTFKLQVSDFGTNELTDLPTATQWTDVPGSSQAVPGTASPISWTVTGYASKWVRVVFTDGGVSTGTFSAAITKRAYT